MFITKVEQGYEEMWNNLRPAYSGEPIELTRGPISCGQSLQHLIISLVAILRLKSSPPIPWLSNMGSVVAWVRNTVCESSSEALSASSCCLIKGDSLKSQS